MKTTHSYLRIALTLIGLALISSVANAQTRIVYNDDFTDNGHSWYEGDTEDYYLKVAYGKYIFESKNSKTWMMTRSVGLSEYEDFVIETNMLKTSGMDNNCLGLLWGYKDPNNCYMFGISGDGNYLYGKWENGTYSSLIQWTASSYINKYNSLNKLTVEKSGDQLKLYINDHLVEQTNYEYPKGSEVGFALNTKARVEFDNLLVKQPPTGTPIFEETFADNSRNWALGDDKSRSMKVESGKYYFEHKRTVNTWLSWVPASINTYEDFIIETSMRKTKGVDDYGYGVMWGLQDENNLYYFGVSGTGYYQYGKFQNGTWVSQINWTASSSIKKGEANLLSIKKEGSQYTFYINGEYVNTAPFEEFFGDKIGFLLNVNMKVEIEDLMVRSLTASQTYDDSYSNEQHIDTYTMWDEAATAYTGLRFEEALSLYQQVLSAEEQNNNIVGKADALAYIGMCFLNLYQIENAKDNFNQSIQTGSANYLPYYGMARISFEMEGNTADAESFCRQGLEMTPGNGELMKMLFAIYRQRGMELYNNQAYGEAAYYLDQAISYDQTDPFTYMFLGFSYYYTQAYGQCVPMFEKALQLDPSIGNNYPNIYEALNHANSMR
ncbi:tetratricopeptide repeat protein [bacterium]|nr:tetratricopeptide repeat protein [bacterium]